MPTVANWLEYLEHLASYHQSYRIGFYGVFFTAITLVVIVLGLPVVYIIINSISIPSNFILAIVSYPIMIMLFYAFGRENYSRNVLIGKSAQRLLDDYFSGEHPELITAQGIQNKWNDIHTRVRQIGDNSRNSKRQRKDIIKNENAFLVWYDNRH